MNVKFRKPTINDSLVYFNWANEKQVRDSSYNSHTIVWEEHQKWFFKSLNDPACYMLIFQNLQNLNIGQVRIQKEDDTNALIGISVDNEHRGKGYASEMLIVSTDLYLREYPNQRIHAYIKENNESSKKAFEKAGFICFERTICKGFPSFHFIRQLFGDKTL